MLTIWLTNQLISLIKYLRNHGELLCSTTHWRGSISSTWASKCNVISTKSTLHGVPCSTFIPTLTMRGKNKMMHMSTCNVLARRSKNLMNRSSSFPNYTTIVRFSSRFWFRARNKKGIIIGKRALSKTQTRYSKS